MNNENPTSKSRGELGSRKAHQPHSADASGTALSNTVPPNSNNYKNLQILRTGIDSLYLSFSGELNQEASIRLAKCKELAQSPHPQTTALAQLELGSHTFEVNDKGRGIFPYVLRDGWYELQLSKADAVNKPLAFVKIASALLTTKSLSFILDDLRAVITELGTLSEAANLSRVDLCVDFITDFPFDQVKDHHWLTRAKTINRYTVSKAFSGFSLGSGGVMSARLYNKTLELTMKPRDYLENLWKENGWNGSDTVWRLEFQLKRDALRQFSILTDIDLPTSLAALWEYSTGQWLRLARPNDTDKTPSRWPTEPIWEALQQAPWEGNQKLARVDIDKGRLPSDKTLFENGISGLTSFMAREGFEDFNKGYSAYIQSAKRYHDAREHYTGKDFTAYVMEKVRVKQRLFNTATNASDTLDTHPADQAVELAKRQAREAYRRARDGE